MAAQSVASREPAVDRPARLLESLLLLVVIVAPFPFGAVRPVGRLALEIAAGAILLIWIARALTRATALPSLPLRAGLLGMLLLVTMQAIPIGQGAVAALTPARAALRIESATPEKLIGAETAVLGRDAREFDRAAALSLDPAASASALRTGVALVSLWLAATTVAAVCGLRRIALGCVASAAFQGLYGLLVMASGHERIWHLPKLHFLSTATGTYVNPNHYADLLVLCLPAGLALLISLGRRGDGSRTATSRAAWWSRHGAQIWLLGLVWLTGLAGLFLSFSRAGIALGVLAIGGTLSFCARRSGFRRQMWIAALIVGAASLPLLSLDAERLADRYSGLGTELQGARVQVWSDSVELVRQYPLLGAGGGAFAASYPLVRSPQIRHFFAHTHNDLLQWLVEGGLLGLLLLCLVAIPLAARIGRVLRGECGLCAIGFAIGLLAMLAHSLVDFPFHIPSNAAIAAVFAGALCGVPWLRDR